MHPAIEILRVSDCTMAAVAGLVGLLLMENYLPQNLLLAALVPFLMAGAGIIVNDIFDLEADRVNAPHRPLPSGRLSVSMAKLEASLLFLAGLMLTLLANIYAFLLALTNLILEVLYAAKLKRVALVGNLVDSWFVASAFAFGALVAHPLSNIQMLNLTLLASLAFLANVGREIYGDLEDVEGDRAAGITTLPMLIGEGKATNLARVFIVLAVVLSPLPWILRTLSWYYLPIVLVADALFLYSLIQTPSDNQRTTKLAMCIALLAFLVGVLVH